MSIATEAKVEQLLERVQKLEEDNALFRLALDNLKMAPLPPSKEPAGGRATLNLKK